MSRRINLYKRYNGSFIPEGIARIPIKQLSSEAKCVYGRLFRYAGKNGICKPKRKTLADEVGMSVSTLDKKIKELCDFGLLEVVRRGLKQSNEYYFLDHEVLNDDVNVVQVGDSESPMCTTQESHGEVTPIVRESLEDNNNIKYYYKNNLPVSLGKNYQKRIFKFYSILWKDKFGIYPTFDYARVGKAIKNLHQRFNEYQIALLIMKHFEWKGATGEDEFTYKRIANAGFPLEWINKNADIYKAFIINNDKINFDSEKDCKKVIHMLLKRYGYDII